MKHPIYELAKNPSDNKWYVIGYTGRNQQGRQEWMAISSPYNTRQAAINYMHKQYHADASARAELCTNL